VGFLRDPQWAAAIARAYNDWISDRYLQHSGRFHALALLPAQDPEISAAELGRCVKVGMLVDRFLNS
jgi:predicted TIM-barrel fold metal-dependent hydrolase